MINITFDTTQFAKDMSGLVNYSFGFLEGVEKGKKDLMSNVGQEVILGIKEFVDTNARMNPRTLHHVYEWNQQGSPEARLFDIDYTTTQNGISFNSRFRQSTSVSRGSKVPFYNKAEIMENGLPVMIRPRMSEVLVFEDDGQKIFTKSPVMVDNPGGPEVQGSYERVFEQFFSSYFTQSFLKTSGILDHLKSIQTFKTNFSKAKRGGRAAGIAVGQKWISRKLI
jgi:hypothetical protein